MTDHTVRHIGRARNVKLCYCSEDKRLGWNGSGRRDTPRTDFKHMTWVIFSFSRLLRVFLCWVFVRSIIIGDFLRSYVGALMSALFVGALLYGHPYTPKHYHKINTVYLFAHLLKYTWINISIKLHANRLTCIMHSSLAVALLCAVLCRA